MKQNIHFLTALTLLFFASSTFSREVSQKEFNKELIKLSAKQQIQLTALLMKFDRSLSQLEMQLNQFGVGPYDVQHCKDTVQGLNTSIVQEFKKVSRLGIYIEEAFNEILSAHQNSIKAVLSRARTLLNNFIEWTNVANHL